MRKAWTAIGCFGPALAFVGLSFIGCDPDLAIALLCLGFMLKGANNSGTLTNGVEISPNYAGTVMGLVNVGANSMGFVTPAVAAYFIQDEVGNVRSMSMSLTVLFDRILLKTGGQCFGQPLEST